MTIAKEVNKVLAVWKQTGLGIPRAGNGSQALRRETSGGKLTIAGFENNEITTHQQSTGKSHGGRSATFAINGILSGNTYSTLFASLLRGTFAATTPVTAAAVTISVPIAGTYALTDAGNTFLTKGIKIGDVIRITAGTYLNAVNRDNNLLVTAVTQTVITGVTLNGSVMIAEGPIAASTITVMGKKLIAPITAQTSDYWTIEEFHSDIVRSELFTDTVFGTADVVMPANGNTTVAFTSVARDRTLGAAQILTTPIAETVTPIVQGVKGAVIVGGVQVASITAATIKIDDGVQRMGDVLGSNITPDVSRGTLKVSGQITAYYEDGIMSGYFDASTPINLLIVIAVDNTNNSEFHTFSMSKVKLDGDDKDNGATGIIRTYPFTAEINGAGGAALADPQSIITIQDSLAA